MSRTTKRRAFARLSTVRRVGCSIAWSRYRLGLMVVAMTCVSSVAAAADDAPPTYRKPSFLSEYDVATQSDRRLSYHLRPFVTGDFSSGFPLLDGIGEQMGEWSTQFLAAPQIAATITQAMPTEGQPPLRRINDLVTECCEILHVDKPQVFVRNHWQPNAYMTQAGTQNFLVLNSALLNLYEGRPEELRFVIGHELGHLKCNHSRTLRAAYGFMVAVQSINLAVVPDKYQPALPTLALGRLFSWKREAEISADRAGLLCCQDPQVAYNALLRLLSGLKADSEWIDPNSPDFDAAEVLRQFHAWENEPFVDLVMSLKRQTVESPFIPDRLAALKMWAESGDYQNILSRTQPPDDETQIVIIKSIEVLDVGAQGTTVDPYVIAYDADSEFLTTKVAEGVRSAGWRNLDHSHCCRNGQPLQFEVWDSNYGKDTLIGGFTIFPVNPQSDSRSGSTSYAASLVWSWNERSNVTRSGLAKVEVEFRERAK